MPYEFRLAIFFAFILSLVALSGCSPAVYSTSTPAPNSLVGGNNGAGNTGDGGAVSGGDSGGNTGDGGPIDQPNLQAGLDDPSLLDAHPCKSGNQDGVLVCHLPPGNPANFHTICLPIPALKAHIDEPHGDQPDILGDCKDAF